MDNVRKNIFGKECGTPPACGESLPYSEKFTDEDLARDEGRPARGSYAHASQRKTKCPRAPTAGSSTTLKSDTGSQPGSRDKKESSTCKLSPSPKFAVSV